MRQGLSWIKKLKIEKLELRPLNSLDLEAETFEKGQTTICLVFCQTNNVTVKQS